MRNPDSWQGYKHINPKMNVPEFMAEYIKGPTLISGPIYFIFKFKPHNTCFNLNLFTTSTLDTFHQCQQLNHFRPSSSMWVQMHLGVGAYQNPVNLLKPLFLLYMFILLCLCLCLRLIIYVYLWYPLLILLTFSITMLYHWLLHYTDLLIHCI